MTDQVVHVPLDRIMLDPNQPRREFDQQELALLRTSMANLGRTLQYITVTASGESWILISGERRVRAARELGWAWLPAIVVEDGVDDGSRFARQLAENTARADLKPWELCGAIDRMRDHAGPTAIAEAAGISVRTVHNYLSLLDHSDLVAELRSGRSLRSALAEARRRSGGAPAPRVGVPTAAVRQARRAVTSLVGTWAKLPLDQRRSLAQELQGLIDAEP